MFCFIVVLQCRFYILDILSCINGSSSFVKSKMEIIKRNRKIINKVFVIVIHKFLLIL